MSLEHGEHVERQKALGVFRAKSERERDLEVRKHEAAIAAAREAHVVAVAEAMRTAAAKRDELDAAIVADLKAAIDPVVAKFGREPRLVAETLGGAWRALAERTQREIGEPLMHLHLCFSFVRALGAEAVDRAGHMNYAPGFAEIGYRAVREMLAGAGVSIIEDALRATERDMETALHKVGMPGTAERFAVLSGYASSRVMGAELAVYDAERVGTSGVRAKIERLEFLRRTNREVHGLPHD